MPIRNRPIFTDTFETLDAFKPDPNSAYIYGISPEERSEHSDQWERGCTDVLFVPITKQGESEFTYNLSGTENKARLRSGVDLRDMWRSLERPKAYLDFTGLEHQIWAPLLKSGLSVGIQLFAVYLEPATYRFSPLPKEGDIFDLSERIKGLAPLPGFASLGEAREEEEVTFIALLGFEGVRFKYCLEQVQPPRNRIVPVVGVPGFQPEYPFYTYDGNRPVLDETGAWKNVRFARANCPFSLFYLLEDIAAAHPLDVIKIAIIGTKPHALGAVLFSMLSPRSVELIYDHPIRKSSRTEGKGRVLLYQISAMSFSAAN
jgi:hypothetical protein